MHDNYYASMTDLCTGYLEVHFSDGTVKEIKDYGLQGTNGLSLLYQFLENIIKEKNWDE